jgi:aspartyl-tRNA(Asn)/glutamyl-tRNA(Gln) amidotransferase subunit B
MEEDAGKSVHDLDPTHTLLDYNRCGVPLVEMVTEPVLRSASDAARFVAEIRRIVRYLGVSDGNMEEGSLRCDANISIRPTGTTPLGTKTEIKNMNSFRHIEQAITYEAARQQACLERGEAVVQETRLWDVASGVTRSMRSKEDAHDYRYFPDPDLPPMIVSDELLASVAATLPELPRQRYARYVTDWGISPTDAETLVEERHRADLFEGVVSRMGPPAIKLVCGTMLTHVLRLEESGSASAPLSVEALLGVCMLRQSDRIASASVAPLIERLATAAEGTSAEAAAEALGVLITATEGDDTLSQLVAEVLSRHTAEVARYRDGEQQLIGFFIGQVMRAYDGAANPKHVRTLLIEQLG